MLLVLNTANGDHDTATNVLREFSTWYDDSDFVRRQDGPYDSIDDIAHVYKLIMRNIGPPAC